MSWRETFGEVAWAGLCFLVGCAAGAWFTGKIGLAVYCGLFALVCASAGLFFWLTERQHQRQMREVDARLKIIEDLRPWAETVIVRGTLMQLYAHAESERTLQ